MRIIFYLCDCQQTVLFENVIVMVKIGNETVGRLFWILLIDSNIDSRQIKRCYHKAPKSIPQVRTHYIIDLPTKLISLCQLTSIWPFRYIS